jgi:predicted nucleotidyltransferase
MGNIYEKIELKRKEILEIASKHGAINLRIFGSVARGDDDEQSDLDLLVDLGDNLSSWFPVGLVEDLENCLGLKVDVVTPKGLKERIREAVLKEARPL